MDTVGVAGMTDPFVARLDGDRLYGRGAYDMKGSLAASMLATATAAERGLAGDVILTAVSDEEFGSVGSEAIARGVDADAAIVTEPTEEVLAVAHRGFVGMEVVVHGVAAHGSRPELGVDAIAKMGTILIGIEELDGRLRSSPTHRHLGSGSVHASLIEGGQEYSSYPARCALQLERRTIPGETREAALDEIQSLLDRAAAADAAFRADLRVTMWRAPFEVDDQAPVACAVRDVARVVCGREPVTAGVPFWADSALLADAGIPTVLFGPIGEGAHAEVEWVDVASLERCQAVYVGVAESICGSGPT